MKKYRARPVEPNEIEAVLYDIDPVSEEKARHFLEENGLPSWIIFNDGEMIILAVCDVLGQNHVERLYAGYSYLIRHSRHYGIRYESMNCQSFRKKI